MDSDEGPSFPVQVGCIHGEVTGMNENWELYRKIVQAERDEQERLRRRHWVIFIVSLIILFALCWFGH